MGAAYYFIAVTVTKDAEGPLATILGDPFVQYPSASGRDPRRGLPFENEGLLPFSWVARRV